MSRLPSASCWQLRLPAASWLREVLLGLQTMQLERRPAWETNRREISRVRLAAACAQTSAGAGPRRGQPGPAEGSKTSRNRTWPHKRSMTGSKSRPKWRRSKRSDYLIHEHSSTRDRIQNEDHSVPAQGEVTDDQLVRRPTVLLGGLDTFLHRVDEVEHRKHGHRQVCREPGRVD